MIESEPKTKKAKITKDVQLNESPHTFSPQQCSSSSSTTPETPHFQPNSAISIRSTTLQSQNMYDEELEDFSTTEVPMNRSQSVYNPRTPQTPHNSYQFSNHGAFMDILKSGIPTDIQSFEGKIEKTINLMTSIDNRLGNLENLLTQIVDLQKNNKTEESINELTQIIHRSILEKGDNRNLEKDDSFEVIKNLQTLQDLNNLNENLKRVEYMNQMVCTSYSSLFEILN
jgi:hypothetical protein